MTGWTFVVPRFAGSPWAAKQGTAISAELDWPTIGVYCPHDPTPWLLGSFSISREVLTQRGEALWSWRRDYLTGDGMKIQLASRSVSTGPQLLVDDQPIDDRLAAVSTDESLRSRVKMTCGICGMSRAFRGDSVQEILTTLWRAGIREIALDALGRRVDHAAT